LAKLYLIPTPLFPYQYERKTFKNAPDYHIADQKNKDLLLEAVPLGVIKLVKQLRRFIVENRKSARNFLSLCQIDSPLQEVVMEDLNEHNENKTDYRAILQPIVNGIDTGLLSEAGCPCIADPGALLVRTAHQMKKEGAAIDIIPFSGPSSLMLALMASGFNGQQFTFHGYVPRQYNARKEFYKNIENVSRKFNAPQIFIDTPYRTQRTLNELIQSLCGNTSLSVASNLTSLDEIVSTYTIDEWRVLIESSIKNFNDKASVFIVLGV
jgi:16S rRNA (cytidine1402-2'-O)-methyltransferase